MDTPTLDKTPPTARTFYDTTTRTPWGKADYAYKYAPGVTFYNTPGHGGFKLSPTVLATIPEYFRLKGGWFEEDCEWAFVATALPHLFSPYEQAEAERSLRNWFPELWERHYGRALVPGESHQRDEATWKAAHANDYIVLSAFGSHPKLPKGMVGVFCGRGGRTKSGQYPADTKWFMVPAEDYNKPRTEPGSGFICNPAIDLEIEALS